MAHKIVVTEKKEGPKNLRDKYKTLKKSEQFDEYFPSNKFSHASISRMKTLSQESCIKTLNTLDHKLSSCKQQKSDKTIDSLSKHTESVRLSRPHNTSTSADDDITVNLNQDVSLVESFAGTSRCPISKEPVTTAESSLEQEVKMNDISPRLILNSSRKISILLEIEGMMTKHCPKIVEAALCSGKTDQKIDGVLDVCAMRSADFTQGFALVQLEMSSVPKEIEDACCHCLSLVGYSCKAIQIPLSSEDLKSSTNARNVVTAKKRRYSAITKGDTRQLQRCKRNKTVLLQNKVYRKKQVKSEWYSSTSFNSTQDEYCSFDPDTRSTPCNSSILTEKLNFYGLNTKKHIQIHENRAAKEKKNHKSMLASIRKANADDILDFIFSDI